jgi:histidine ammonia-lyase
VKVLNIDGQLSLEQFNQFVFKRASIENITISDECLKKSQNNFIRLNQLMEQGIPIYGVTTGFGNNANQYVDAHFAQILQKNLVNYLTCGLGKELPVEASRAMFLIRLNSLSQGISAVSSDLLLHMKLLLTHDIIPVVPQEGSLGASGDLIPLAYLGQTIQGYGKSYYKGDIHETASIFKKLDIPFYKLKPKEGLAIVNGTSTMAGLMGVNLKFIDSILNFSQLASSLLCLVIQGKREAFGVFINEVAKKNPGQKMIAENIRKTLDAENYFPGRGQDVTVQNSKTSDYVQDRYSMRCVPQILGPILDYQKTSWEILDFEMNSVSDNPVINEQGDLEMGGNFYGGYISQAMDMSKINLAHICDLIDRQVMMMFDDKKNQTLPTNLVDEKALSANEVHLSHSLKGLHQATSAITSELMQKSIPNGIFSRSSESHNQDKVSLGMSSATSCAEMIDGVFKLFALQFSCLCQAIDLKNIELKSEKTKNIYGLVRQHVPHVTTDMALGENISALVTALKESALHA